MITVDDLSTRAVLTVPEAAELLGLAERSVRRALEAGDLPVLRVGRRTLIPTAPLSALLGLEKSEAAPATGAAATTNRNPTKSPGDTHDACSYRG